MFHPLSPAHRDGEVTVWSEPRDSAEAGTGYSKKASPRTDVGRDSLPFSEHTCTSHLNHIRPRPLLHLVVARQVNHLVFHRELVHDRLRFV